MQSASDDTVVSYSCLARTADPHTFVVIDIVNSTVNLISHQKVGVFEAVVTEVGSPNAGLNAPTQMLEP